MLQGGLPSFEMQAGTLPPLPSDEVGNLLLETVYLYTQARYCLVDWVQVRDWHQRRHEICYAKRDDSMDAQMGKAWLSLLEGWTADLLIGAYFVWIIYAIGANFVPNPEHPPKVRIAHIVGVGGMTDKSLPGVFCSRAKIPSHGFATSKYEYCASFTCTLSVSVSSHGRSFYLV